MNSFRLVDGGSRFVATFDSFAGMALGNPSNGIGGEWIVPADQMWDLENALFDQQAGVRRRAAIGGSNGKVITGTGATGYLRTGTGSAIDTAVGWSGSNMYAQVGGTATLISSSLTAATSKPASADNLCVFVSGSVPVTMTGTGTAAYSTGTITATRGSATITGAGGASWTSDHVGMILQVNTDTQQVSYVVQSVDSATQITLDRVYLGTASGAGLAYSLARTKNLQSAAGSMSATAVCVHQNRLFMAYGTTLSWSGIIGGLEPDDSTTVLGSQTPYRGIHCWNTNANTKLPRFGSIRALASIDSGLVVFCTNGMYVLRGTSTFNGVGSLDASTAFHGITCANGFAHEAVDGRVYFVDSTRGPMVYTGEGRPVQIGLGQVPTYLVASAASVAAYGEWVLFAAQVTDATLVGTSRYVCAVYHASSGRWSRIAIPYSSGSPTLGYATSNGGTLTGLFNDREIDLSTIFTSLGGSTDVVGIKYPFGFTTGKVGAPNLLLQPDRIFVTYNSSHTPSCAVTVHTGGTSALYSTDTDHYWSFTIDDATSYGVFVTVERKVSVSKAPYLQVLVRDTGSSTQAMEFLSITVEGDVTGEGHGATEL